MTLNDDVSTLFVALAELAVVYTEMGLEEQARGAVAEALRISPGASVAAYRKRLPYKDPAELERFLDGLRKAGLPE